MQESRSGVQQTAMGINQAAIKAVIWDLGGVIVRTLDYSGRTRWEERLGFPSRGLEELVFNGEMGRKASLGQASVDEVWNWIIEQLDLHLDSREELERDFWMGDRVDGELVQFIHELRPRYKIGLLSNAWPSLRNELENIWHIADAFDEIVISAEVGMVKPNARIYEHILERMDNNPEETVFVDDFMENIAAAQAIGIQTIIFQDPTQAMQDLKGILGI